MESWQSGYCNGLLIRAVRAAHRFESCTLRHSRGDDFKSSPLFLFGAFMNIILFDKSDVTSPGLLQFSDYRFEHIRTVLKKAPDEKIRVGERNGLLGTAIVVEINDTSVLLKYELTDEAPDSLPITLVVALPRPKSFRKLLHTATVMGVKEIHVIKSWRVDKSYWSSPAVSEKGIETVISEGLMQTRDTVSPEVHFHRAFKPFVEDSLPSLMENRTTHLFHPCKEVTGFEIEREKQYLFIIGPEGGFIEYEVELMQSQGAKLTSLGARIQRVEQAIASVLGYSSISLL